MNIFVLFVFVMMVSACDPQPNDLCDVVGVVETITTPEKPFARWQAVIGGVEYQAAFWSNWNTLKRTIRPEQIVCIIDPEDDQQVRADEILILQQP